MDDAPPLVLSPVVIAMWEPMARALGWPDRAIGWSDIAELTASGKTWADYGFPEWGSFQFGHTHPAFSNSGITSILAMAYAATGKTRDLTLADIEDPATAAFIREVESGVIHMSPRPTFRPPLPRPGTGPPSTPSTRRWPCTTPAPTPP